MNGDMYDGYGIDVDDFAMPSIPDLLHQSDSVKDRAHEFLLSIAETATDL